MRKVEPETWKHGTDLQWPVGMGEGDNGGKKGEELLKEQIGKTHGHEQWCGYWLWEQAVGWAEEGKGEKIGTTVTE